MAVATIRMVLGEPVVGFFFTKDPVRMAKDLLREGRYKVVGSIGVPGLAGEAAAEEVFDLTNNPCRQDERVELYGRGRSVSVGDIVNVDGVDWLCASVGWKCLS